MGIKVLKLQSEMLLGDSDILRPGIDIQDPFHKRMICFARILFTVVSFWSISMPYKSAALP